MSWRRVFFLVHKEMIQIRRDKRLLRMMIVMPVMQLIIFGYALAADVHHVSTAIVDLDRSQESRRLVARFTGAPHWFQVVAQPDRPAEIDKMLDRGTAQLAIWIPRGYAANLGAGRSAPILAAIDGTDSKTASIVGGYAATVAASENRSIVLDARRRAGTSWTPLPSIDVRARAWYNPDLRNESFLIPGVLCMLLLVITMLLTSLAVVREREIGTLEQLIVTPITSSELMAGKTIPFLLIGYFDALLVLAAMRFWFGVPIAGSVPLLLVLTATFLCTGLGLGLLISTISRTQQQAMVTVAFILQPSVLLSGFMFPIENMPYAIQLITYAIPLRYFLQIVRGILLRGVGLSVLWPQTAALTGFAVATFAAAITRFSKRVA